MLSIGANALQIMRRNHRGCEMRGLIAAGFLLSLTCTGAPAAAQVQAQQPRTVAAVLQDAGYRAELTKDQQGDPMIKSSSGGYEFEVFFYNCTDNADCRTVQFHSGYSEASDASAEAMNEWNKAFRFGRAYVKDGIAHLEMDVDLDDGGMSPALFQDNLEFWVSVKEDFEERIGY